MLAALTEKPGVEKCAVSVSVAVAVTAQLVSGPTRRLARLTVAVARTPTEAKEARKPPRKAARGWLHYTGSLRLRRIGMARFVTQRRVARLAHGSSIQSAYGHITSSAGCCVHLDIGRKPNDHSRIVRLWFKIVHQLVDVGYCECGRLMSSELPAHRVLFCRVPQPLVSSLSMCGHNSMPVCRDDHVQDARYISGAG